MTVSDTDYEQLAARVHSRLEPLHAFIYFGQELPAQLAELGIKPGRATYFAGRAAPMGAVNAATVAATFYNFNPALIAHLMPRIWAATTPEQIVDSRWIAAQMGLRRLLGELAESPSVAEAAALLMEAASACTPEGRPLYAAHAAQTCPDEPLVQLWHAITLLREYRGDGHIAALVASGLTGLQALVTHTATGHGFTQAAAQASRGWSEQEWDQAVIDLCDKGILGGDGALTDAGVALRAHVEEQTNRMTLLPWRTLGAEQTMHVMEIAKPLQRQLLGAGAFPSGVFS